MTDFLWTTNTSVLPLSTFQMGAIFFFLFYCPNSADSCLYGEIIFLFFLIIFLFLLFVYGSLSPNGLHNWMKHLGHVIWEENHCFLPNEEKQADYMVNRQADCDKFQCFNQTFPFIFGSTIVESHIPTLIF